MRSWISSSCLSLANNSARVFSARSVVSSPSVSIFFTLSWSSLSSCSASMVSPLGVVGRKIDDGLLWQSVCPLEPGSRRDGRPLGHGWDVLGSWVPDANAVDRRARQAEQRRDEHRQVKRIGRRLSGGVGKRRI